MLYDAIGKWLRLIYKLWPLSNLSSNDFISFQLKIFRVVLQLQHDN